MGHLHSVKKEYLALRRHIDRSVCGLPEGPAVYEILKYIFTEEEARLAVKLPLIPVKLDLLASRFGEDLGALKNKLDAMADRGLVFDFIDPNDGAAYYFLAPPVVGFFETSIMPMRIDINQKALAAAFHRYIYEDGAFSESLFGGKTSIGRTLVHETALPDGLSTDILDYEKATALVEQAGRGAISLCFCRHKAEHLGRPCAHPQNNCITLDGGADFIIRHGHGREASRAELLDVLAEARERGLVQIVDNVQSQPTYLCNCCGCCCAQLSAINQWGLTHAVSTSNYIATVKAALCSGCGRCARACPVQAISVKPVLHEVGCPHKLVAQIDESICLGCGVCHAACKKASLNMEQRKIRVLTPLNTVERILRMALERGKLSTVIFNNPDSVTAQYFGRLVDAFTRLEPVHRLLLTEQVQSRFISLLLSIADKRQKKLVKDV